jgi:hypothetical protein
MMDSTYESMDSACFLEPDTINQLTLRGIDSQHNLATFMVIGQQIAEKQWLSPF